MSRAEYQALLSDLLSGDCDKVRIANRQLFVFSVHHTDDASHDREADLVLAEVAGRDD